MACQISSTLLVECIVGVGRSLALALALALVLVLAPKQTQTGWVVRGDLTGIIIVTHVSLCIH